MLTHVAVVDVEAGVSRPDQMVMIRGSRIERVAPNGAFDVTDGAEIFDETGRFVMPGLWDMHVHVAGNRRALASLLRSGITGARDMGGDFAWLAEERRRIQADPLAGPRLVLAGPMLRGPKSTTDASDPESLVVRTPQEGVEAVAALAALGVDFVKVHEDLSPATFLAIAQAAGKHRLPLAGHVPAGVTPEEVSDAGVRSIEHLEWLPDACLPLLDVDPAAAPPPLPANCEPTAIAALLRRLTKNGTWLDPTPRLLSLLGTAQVAPHRGRFRRTDSRASPQWRGPPRRHRLELLPRIPRCPDRRKLARRAGRNGDDRLLAGGSPAVRHVRPGTVPRLVPDAGDRGSRKDRGSGRGGGRPTARHPRHASRGHGLSQRTPFCVCTQRLRRPDECPEWVGRGASAQSGRAK